MKSWPIKEEFFEANLDDSLFDKGLKVVVYEEFELGRMDIS